jgi:hypothetical protein
MAGRTNVRTQDHELPPEGHDSGDRLGARRSYGVQLVRRSGGQIRDQTRRMRAERGTKDHSRRLTAKQGYTGIVSNAVS